MISSITLLPGDGVGPEVIEAARLVLNAAGERWSHRFEYREALIGGVAIDHTGTALPVETVELCRSADAVMLGAVGGPKWDDPSARVRPEQGLLGIRRELGLFANLRPVRAEFAIPRASPLKPALLAKVDMIVVRELTGGMYFGDKTLEPHESGERATDVCSYSTGEIERIVRVAGELARLRRGRVTSVDKANVLETSRLWRRVTVRVMRDEFPEVELAHLLVDSAAMQLIREPAAFDVIVTENMFGDILTDEAAVLAGSIGLLPSASLGSVDSTRASRMGLYEPIHGSAPTIAGTGMANPIGAILSAALMLRYSLQLEPAATGIEQAVRRVLLRGLGTPDIVVDGALPSSTMDLACAVASEVAG